MTIFSTRHAVAVLAPAALVVAACGSADSEPPVMYRTGGSGGTATMAPDPGPGDPSGNGGAMQMPDPTATGGTAAGGTGSLPNICNGRDDLYVAGMSKVGMNGITVALVNADPAPPALNDNTWTVTIEDAERNPIEGATINVVPHMPDHRHGTPIVTEVTENGSGEYLLDPVNMFMPGYWTVRIDVELVDGTTDQVTFKFCVGQ